MKVHLYPHLSNKEDQGDGGIRRVLEAQHKYLPDYGIELVDDPLDADLFACHISIPPSYLNRFPRTPVVAHCHGLYWQGYDWPHWALESNRQVMEIIRVADATTVPSEWVANSVRRHTSRPVHIIPHGIDMADWPDAKQSDAVYVLWNKTRPDPVCDPEPLNIIASLMPDVQFVTTFGNADRNVIVTGNLPFEQAKKAVANASVYLATTKETFGIGTLEALAAGVPVAGFAWGGQTDIVRQGVDGYLARPNDMRGLEAAIRRCLAERETLSANARQRAGDYPWQAAMQLYANLYEAVYARRQAENTAPRTSIIVRHYQLEKYLADCLRSVADQSDTDWECIIVDDASPNKVGVNIAKQFAAKDPRFRIIENETNQFISEAFNVGIRAAKGRYITAVDADDMLPRYAIGLLADELDAHKNLHIVYGNVVFTKEDGKTPQVYPRFEDKPGMSGWPVQFMFDRQVRQYNLLPYSSMYRREAWLNTGGFRPRCRNAEDADFWVRLSSYGYRPRMVTEEPTLIYRVRDDSVSAKAEPVDWIAWFPWGRDSHLTPAGAVTAEQLPVASMENAQVTVVIPCGPNHRKLVKTAVDSVDAQFYRDWHCTVVFDGEGDEPELPAWVKILRTSDERGRPSGVAAARNYGIEQATTPLFLPLDADDFLQPNALQQMIDAYNRTGDIIYTDFWEDPDAEGRFTVYQLKDYDPAALTRGVLHCVTALTPKQVWERVGGYDESLPAWEDWDFQFKVADAGICSRRLAAPLWTYRKWTGLRRQDNFDNVEENKVAIKAKWGRFWEGEKPMACGSCSGRATIQPVANGTRLSPERQAAQVASNNDSAVLVQYTGEKHGKVTYRGQSGTVYSFAAGMPPRYVLTRDIPMFQGRPDFKILADRNESNGHSAPASAPSGGPVLAATS